MARLEQHRVGRDIELCDKELLQRPHDGGDEISAASDWLGENNIGAGGLFELPDGLGEFVEIAAEASARNFANVEALGSQTVGIDQIGRLVVGDDADFLAAALIVAREAGDGGRFARAEEAAEHDEANGRHRIRGSGFSRSQKSGIRRQIGTKGRADKSFVKPAADGRANNRGEDIDGEEAVAVGAG